MNSPALSDGNDVNRSNSSSYIHDQGLTDTDPTSPSSLPHFSTAGSSSELNTEPTFDALNVSIHSSDNLFTAFCESVDGHGHSGGSDDKNGGSAGDPVSVLAVSTSNGTISIPSFGSGGVPDDGWQNPLHIAAAKGHDRIVRILLQHNIDCNEKDSDGLTPLIHATLGGYGDVVQLLLSHGATIGTVDSQHRSALHWAVMHRREGVLKILLDWCVTNQMAIDIYDEAGRTPLHTAVDMGYDAGVQLLLQLGANARYRTRKPKYVC